MATFAHIIYAVLDLLKERSDDAYYTEEHVKFLAKNIRATLLERKYKGSRNSTFNSLSSENLQQICLKLIPADDISGDCNGNWLVSTVKIPELLPNFSGVTCTINDLLQSNVTFIPRERMPYVGHNKWLKNITYASRSIDGKLYLRSNNPQYIYLENVGLTGVFVDPEEAAKLSHEACTTGMCDIMSTKFPLEAELIPSLIEIITQELIGSRYAPEDKENNAKDDLAELNAASRVAASPAESRTYKPREDETE